MSHFRLFSFECLNGVLGDESTNNRSIEVQLMTPFLKDNSHFQLLSSVHSAASDITSIFSCAVLDHAYSFASTRHLDIVSNLSTNSVAETLYQSQSTPSQLSEVEIDILSNVYHKVFPAFWMRAKAFTYQGPIAECTVLPSRFKRLNLGTMFGHEMYFSFPTPAHQLFTQFSLTLMFVQQKFIIL